MAINKFHPHIIVIPEDDANRQIAIGFALGCKTKQLRIDSVGKGWIRTLKLFVSEYVPQMRQFSNRFIVLVIDFDKESDRVANIRKDLPTDISERVFILGCFDEPEKLKTEFGPYEHIGQTLARECISGNQSVWQNSHMNHNASELIRFKAKACGVIF